MEQADKTFADFVYALKEDMNEYDQCTTRYIINKKHNIEY